MSVSRRGDNYFIRSSSNNAQKHNLSCDFHFNYTSSSDSEKGWIKDEDDKLIANLQSKAFGKRINKKNNNTASTNAPRRPYGINGKGSNKVTLFGLMMKLNIISWDKYIKGNKETPDSLGPLLKQTYGMDDGSEKKTKISCPIDIFEDAHNSIKNRDINKEDKFRTIVGGFVKRNERGFIEFVSLELMPIIEQGLWSESSYEDITYTKLINENRLFSKGYEGVDIYGGFVPDIIFKDTEKETYGEVFGIRNIESYDERKEEKIELARNSEELFNFWYWDVHRDKILPNFPI